MSVVLAAFNLCFGFALPPVVTWFVRSTIGQIGGPPSSPFAVAWASTAFLTAAICVWAEPWPAPAGMAASGMVALAIWWRRRKKRRNVAALLGAKSRQLRDALVRKAREAGTPRPVLRPVPVQR